MSDFITGFASMFGILLNMFFGTVPHFNPEEHSLPFLLGGATAVATMFGAGLVLFDKVVAPAMEAL